MNRMGMKLFHLLTFYYFSYKLQVQSEHANIWKEVDASDRYIGAYKSVTKQIMSRAVGLESINY